MPRYEFIEDEVTANEMPKETKRSEPSKKARFEFIDEPAEKDWTSYLDKIAPDFTDIAAQSLKGGAKGLVGTYGNLLNLAGLQRKGNAPGQEAITRLEHGASDVELAALSDSEDILPRYTSLPSGEEVGSGIEALGGPGKAKSRGGRFASRISELVGGGAALGAPQTALSTAAGTVGQSLEEAGAPRWLQAVGEIVTFLKGSKAKTPIQSSSKEANVELDRLRKLGYSDQDLTLAKNALEQRGWLKKSSKLTVDAENKFKSAMKNSEQHVENILEQSFPGMAQEGTSGLREASEELFGSLDELARNVVIENPAPFVKNVDKAIERLRGTLANTPQEKEVIGILEAAKNAAVEGRGADVYTRFYRGLNQIGKWGNPREREHVFTLVKDAIKQTFRNQGPEGAKVANALEEANKSWIRYLNAEDLKDILGKATSEEGINFTKLSRSLDNPNNFDIVKKAVGKESASNMKKIAETASSIKDLEKKMIGGEVKKALGNSKLYALAYSLATGDITPLKTYLGVIGSGRVATKFLTDPRYQNLTIKLINAVDDQKWNVVRDIAQSIDKQLNRDQKSFSTLPVKKT